jgi:putative peptidoglycan lipid II flippase
MGGVGLALASSLSGFVLLFLTLKEFGFSRFLAILSVEKFALLVLILNIEAVIIYLFLEFIKG